MLAGALVLERIVTCLQPPSLFSSEASAGISTDPDWMKRGPAVLLWMLLFVLLFGFALAVRRDRLQAQIRDNSVTQLAPASIEKKEVSKFSCSMLLDPKLFLLYALESAVITSNNLSKPFDLGKSTATVAPIDDDDSETQAKSDDQSMALMWMWQTFSLFRALHPWSNMRGSKSWVSHKQRAALFTATLLGSISLGTAFILPTAIGRATPNPASCQPFDIGKNSTLLFFNAILTSVLFDILGRGLRNASTKLKNMTTVPFVVLTTFGISIAVYVLLAFLANTTDNDGRALLLQGFFVVLYKLLLKPLTMAVFLATLSKLVEKYWPEMQERVVDESEPCNERGSSDSCDLDSVIPVATTDNGSQAKLEHSSTRSPDVMKASEIPKPKRQPSMMKIESADDTEQASKVPKQEGQSSMIKIESVDGVEEVAALGSLKRLRSDTHLGNIEVIEAPWLKILPGTLENERDVV